MTEEMNRREFLKRMTLVMIGLLAVPLVRTGIKPGPVRGTPRKARFSRKLAG